MIRLGIVPACGAALPGGPVLASACTQDGRLSWERLHLHHEPPLTGAERQDPRAICDPVRVVWLCERCHSRRTGVGAA